MIELQGSVGASPAIDRDAGFKAAIADHPEIEIVFEQTAEFARDEGLTVTEQALQANPDVDAIVCANDDMAFGAAEAAAGAGLDIPIIGFDALPEALQADPGRHAGRDDRAVPRPPDQRRDATSSSTSSATAPNRPSTTPSSSRP